MHICGRRRPGGFRAASCTAKEVPIQRTPGKVEKPRQAFYTRMPYRIVTAAFGFFLSIVGLYILLLADTSGSARLIAGPLIVLPGCNMLIAAWKAKESWLSRLGPLP